MEKTGTLRSFPHLGADGEVVDDGSEMGDFYSSPDYEWFRMTCGKVVGFVHSSANLEGTWNDLDANDRGLYVVGQFVTIFLNGGLDGYLRSPLASNLEDLIRLLKFIGYRDVAETVNNAVGAVIPDGLSDSCHDREVVLRRFGEERGIPRIDEIFSINLDGQIWSSIRKAYEEGALQVNS